MYKFTYLPIIALPILLIGCSSDPIVSPSHTSVGGMQPQYPHPDRTPASNTMPSVPTTAVTSPPLNTTVTTPTTQVPSTASNTVVTTPTTQTPSTSSNTSNTASGNTYMVKKGDTVFSIMRATGIHWKKIIELNALKAPSYVIQPGQHIRLS